MVAKYLLSRMLTSSFGLHHLFLTCTMKYLDSLISLMGLSGRSKIYMTQNIELNMTRITGLFLTRESKVSGRKETILYLTMHHHGVGELLKTRDACLHSQKF